MQYICLQEKGQHNILHTSTSEISQLSLFHLCPHFLHLYTLRSLSRLCWQVNILSKLKIVQPKASYRIFGGSQDKPVPGLGQNPKSGVTVDYYLPKKLDSIELKLEVLQKNYVMPITC